MKGWRVARQGRPFKSTMGTIYPRLSRDGPFTPARSPAPFAGRKNASREVGIRFIDATASRCPCETGYFVECTG